MLNRKLVYPYFLFACIIMPGAGWLSAAPIYVSDSILKPKDSAEVVLLLNERTFAVTGFPAGYDWELPPLPANAQRDTYVKQYTSKYAGHLEIIRNRSDRFFTVMDSVFGLYELPLELKYLAVIESELKTTAMSKVGARGTWQLMPATARILKLRVSATVDERTHLHKSTVAAAKYLRDLYALFDDWLLTIAAYNSGPGPVYKAIKMSGSRNFWKLQHFLPAETRAHVKKFISVHYYFEGRGSITTLTRSERTHYYNTLQEFVTKHSLLLKSTPEKNRQDTGASADDKTDYVVRSNGELHLGHEQQQGLKSIVDE